MKTITLCLLTLITFTARADDDPFVSIRSYKQGQSRSAEVAIDKAIHDARPADYAAIETKLIAVLEDEKAPPEAKSLTCKWLARIGSDKCVPALSKLLADEKLSHMARFALEPNTSAAAGEALRTALATAKGNLLIGVINSVGEKRDAGAVTALADLAKKDAQVSLPAINALGKIGTIEAANALEGITDSANQVSLAQARLECASRLAASNPAAANAIYTSLAGSKDSPVIRLAANIGLLSGMTGQAQIDAVMTALSSNDQVIWQAAAQVVRDSASPELADAVAAKLVTLKAEGQAAVLAVLVDRQHVKLRPALLQILANSKEPALRLTALEAMKTFASAEDIPMLAGIAATNVPDEPSAARKVLEQNNSAGFKEALLRQAQEGESARRVVAIKVLTMRSPQSFGEPIAKMIDDSDEVVRREALASLSSIGTPAQLTNIARSIEQAKDDGMRNAAADAAQKICARATDKAACAAVLLPALDKATSPQTRGAILKVLPHIGTDAALAAVRKAVDSDDADTKDAGIRALAEWTSPAAADQLLQLAQTAPKATHFVLALRGYVRLVRNSTDLSPDKRFDMLKSALAAAKRPEERKLVISALGDVPSAASLDLLRPFLKEAGLKDESAQAAIKVATVLISTNSSLARTALEEIKSSTQNAELLKQANEALKNIDALAGCITTWRIAGPFTVDQKDGLALIDVPLGPEVEGATTDWKNPPAPSKPESAWQIDLLKAFGGNNRVAYAKASVWSEKAQKVRLEIGSDDGVKVMLNGKQVFAKNQVRRFIANEDKVKTELKQGENTLLLKITQGGGDWAFSMRIRDEKGGAIEGLSLTAPPGK